MTSGHGPDGAPVQLYLFLSDRSARAVQAGLAQSGVSWTTLAHPRALRLSLGQAAVGPVALALAERLSVEEAGATRALCLPAGQAPRLADLGRVTTLRHLAQEHLARWLEGIMNGRLTSHFQPIVHAADPTRLFAHEALMRGVDEDGGIVPPGRLIEAARQTGLSEALERLAQRSALSGMAAHRSASTLFLNLHPDSVCETGTLHDTHRLILRLGIPRERVVFEIVEMDRIRDLERFRRAMGDFRQAGFRFALDDLGAGYAGLNLLHQLRPDFVKLDMALVRDVHADPAKALVTRMVLELSRRLGMKTIGEGVEQPSELAWLRAHGADYLQGFLIARPAAAPAR